MKFIFAVVCCTLLSLELFAQNLYIHSEDGVRFWVAVNNYRQYYKPVSKIRITNIKEDNFKWEIVFEDKRIPTIAFNSAFQYNTRTDVAIVKDDKGSYTTKINTDTKDAPNTKPQVVFAYRNYQLPDAVDSKTNDQISSGPSNQAIYFNAVSGERFWLSINGVKLHNDPLSRIKITNIGTPKNSCYWTIVFEDNKIPMMEGSIINQYVDEISVKIIKNLKDEYIIKEDREKKDNSTPEGTFRYKNYEIIDSGILNDNPDNNEKNVYENNTVKIVNDNSCKTSMSDEDFSSYKESLSEETFEDKKMNIAKQFTKKNCLSVLQIKEIAALFTFDKNKFEYITFAYDFCTEKNKYIKLNDVFTFGSFKDQFNDFLNKKQ